MATAQTLAPIIVMCSVSTAITQLVATSIAVRATTFAIQNQGTVSAYIGNSAVTTSAGFALATNETLVLGQQDLRQGHETFDPSNYYAVASTQATLCIFYNERTRQ